MATDTTSLTGIEKASILLISLGTSVSAETLKLLSEQEVETLGPEMERMRSVDPQLRDAVLVEFEQMRTLVGSSVSSQPAAQDGTASEQNLVVGTAAGLREQPFQCLADTDAPRIAKLLANEQPQLIALVLSNIPPEKAAGVISLLDPDIQVEVAFRIASSDDYGPEVIREIEEVIKADLAAAPTAVEATVGPEALVEILSRAERSTERLVLDALNEREPEMGAEVRRRMFLFEDIVRLPDRAIQLLLREMDQEQLRIALKGADESIKELVFRNMSERAAESLKEDLELLQNVKTKDIESAQQKMGYTVRHLLTSGQIVIDEEEETPAQEEQQELERAA